MWLQLLSMKVSGGSTVTTHTLFTQLCDMPTASETLTNCVEEEDRGTPETQAHERSVSPQTSQLMKG